MQKAGETVTQVLLLLILAALIGIGLLLYVAMPGRYQYDGHTIIDTRTGVVKYAPSVFASGVPFDKMPIPSRNIQGWKYVEQVRAEQDEVLKEELERLYKEVTKK